MTYNINRVSRLSSWVSPILLSVAAVACSDAGDGGSLPGVEVNTDPLICNMTDADGGLAPVLVSCTVVVGNAMASEEGVKVSVNSVLPAMALPEVCPYFSPGVQNSTEFGAATKEALQAAYVRANADWTIESVKCK